jgi:hypothetical protein
MNAFRVPVDVSARNRFTLLDKHNGINRHLSQAHCTTSRAGVLDLRASHRHGDSLNRHDPGLPDAVNWGDGEECGDSLDVHGSGAA